MRRPTSPRASRMPGGSSSRPLTASTSSRELAPELERFVSTLGFEEPDTVLATVLFTDIVGSTARLARARRRSLARAASNAIMRSSASSSAASAAARSTPPATASSPPSTGRSAPSARAQAIVDGVRELGLEIRAGLHTGECQVVDDKLAGIAVQHRRARRRRSTRRARYSSPRPSRTSLLDRGCGSRNAGVPR